MKASKQREHVAKDTSAGGKCEPQTYFPPDFSLSTGAGSTSARCRVSQKVHTEPYAGFFCEKPKDNGLGVDCGIGNAEAIGFSQGFREVRWARMTPIKSRADSMACRAS